MIFLLPAPPPREERVGGRAANEGSRRLPVTLGPSLMTFALASQFHAYFLWVNACLA